MPRDVGAALLTGHVPGRIPFPGACSTGRLGRCQVTDVSFAVSLVLREKPGIDFGDRITGVAVWEWLSHDQVFW